MATKRYTLPVVAKIEFTHIFNGIFNINVREKKDYVWEEVEFEYCQDHQKEERQGRNSPIVEHYSSIKNSCFVTCVSSAFCS
jgi:hypothetical protein